MTLRGSSSMSLNKEMVSFAYFASVPPLNIMMCSASYCYLHPVWWPENSGLGGGSRKEGKSKGSKPWAEFEVCRAIKRVQFWAKGISPDGRYIFPYMFNVALANFLSPALHRDDRDHQSQVNVLMEKTACSLDSHALQLLFVSVQQNNLELCIKFAMK